MTQNDVVDTPGNAGKEAPRVAPTIAYTIRSVNKGTWQLVIMKIHFLQRNTESQNHSLFPMNSTNPTQIFVNVFFNIGVTLMSRKTAGDHIQLASETRRRSFAPSLSHRPSTSCWVTDGVVWSRGGGRGGGRMPLKWIKGRRIIKKIVYYLYRW